MEVGSLSSAITLCKMKGTAFQDLAQECNRDRSRLKEETVNKNNYCISKSLLPIPSYGQHSVKIFYLLANLVLTLVF